MRPITVNSTAHGSPRASIEALLKLVKANKPAELKQELGRGNRTQQDLHSLLFEACYRNREVIVDMLVDHPCYTTQGLAKIVVDALESMQSEFAFYLLGHEAFRGRALNAALHEAAGRKDDGDLEEMIAALIKAGADTGSRNQAGRTALEIARSAGYVSDSLAELLQPASALPVAAVPTGPQVADALALPGLPPEILYLCLDNIPLLDRKTINSASRACSDFHLHLTEKREDARALFRSANLGSIPVNRRADHFRELIGRLEKNAASSASGKDSGNMALILSNLIQQIRHLKKGAERTDAYDRTLKVCLALPQATRFLPELARTLDCLSAGEREPASKVLLAAAGKLSCSDNGMRLLAASCRLVSICCMHNAMDLEPRFKALAKECILLPDANRLDITLDWMRMLSANKDEIAQFKGLASLQSLIASLPLADKAIALTRFADHFSGFPQYQFPWIGIFEWFVKQISALAQPDYRLLCHRLLEEVSARRSEALDQILKKLAKGARSFTPNDRVSLLCDLATRLSAIPNDHKMRESWFRWLVTESVALLPEHRRQLLTELCCCLHTLHGSARVESYLLIVSQMKSLPASEQFNLMNGAGLLAKLHYLRDSARLVAFKSLADIVDAMPLEQRLIISWYMLSEACLQLVPASPERDIVCAALAASARKT